FTFTLMIYTLTISFGDIGKAFAVVIMVIQIAGSSGTYPIELLPDIFQAIYRYFPFPYAINAMRETISGMYENDYSIYMGQLLIFAVASLVVGLVIRKPFMKVNHFIEERMEDTQLM
ncbi:MAG: YhgE/Pip domain-containing protein, partial [Lachnospiraceae bacterium]